MRIRSCSCSSWRAPTYNVAGIDSFSSSSLWQARATTLHCFQGRLDSRLPWQPSRRYPHLYKFLERHMPLPLRSDRWKNNRYLSCLQQKKVLRITVLPASEDGGCGSFFDYQRNGRFPRRFCILIKSAFCIGVLRRSSTGLLFSLSIPYILVFWACSFLIITEAATFPSLR